MEEEVAEERMIRTALILPMMPLTTMIRTKEVHPLPIIIIITMAAVLQVVEVGIIGTEVGTMKETRTGAEEM
jgi:hypothetical protein